MRQNAGFLPTPESMTEPHLTDSAHCGSCHTLYTPVLDANGVQVPGTDPLEYAEFPEQTTYLEWEHSGVPKTCQDCHLPDAVGSVVISNRPRRLAARNQFWQHHFVGGNSYMVGLLEANADALGETADAGHLQDTIKRTVTQLEKETAGLTVTPERTKSLLTVTVDVENLAGHKLPSGLPSRRCWLHVVVTDASNNNTIFESGRPLDEGRIEGNDAEDPDSPLPYEPHYDTINKADQVQIYEPIMLNTDEEVTYTLLWAFSYAKDNRLLPSGFDKVSASGDIAVYGLAVADENFIGGSDQVAYKIALAGAKGKLNITVELLYQTLSYPFVTDLATTDTELVGRFVNDLYVPADNVPVVLGRAQTSVN